MSVGLPASAAPGDGGDGDSPMPPWPSAPTLSASLDLDYEIAGGVQPYAEVLIDWDAFYDYDEECWDEIHGVVAPEVESDPLTINGPFMLDFEYEPIESLADPLQPTAGPYLDTRYWEPSARDQFVGCMPKLGEPRKFLYAVDEGADPFVAENCFSEVVADWGSPCEPIEPGQCLNTDFYDSWCGRAAFDLHGDDEEWLCNTVIAESADAAWSEAEATDSPILVPERTFGPMGERRHYLEREHGVIVTADFASTTYDADVYAGPASAEGATLDHEAQRAVWATNGGVFSCAEYADEATKSFSDLQAFARANSRRSRAVFDRAFYGPDPIIQQASSYPTVRWNITDAHGDRMRDAPPWWTGIGQCGDDGMVPWPRHPHGAGSFAFYPDLVHPVGGAYRLFPRDAAGCADAAFTFKNAYYYIYQLRRGPSADFQVSNGFDRCQGWADSKKIHYRVNAGWQQRMAQATLDADYTDAELDYLARKQVELLALYTDFITETDPDVREDMTHEIDEALAEGARMGCIPKDPDRLTPCDWAPSYFSEEGMRRIEAHRERLETECIEEYGEGPLDNDMLRGRFFDPSLLSEILNPTCTPGSTIHCPHFLWDDINDLYQEATACPGGGTGCATIDYTGDHEGIARNIDLYEEYMDLIKGALSSSTVRPGVLYDQVERSYGSSLFGAKLRAAEQLDMIGEQPEYATQHFALTDAACGVFPNAEAETELELEIFGLPAGGLHTVIEEVAKTDLVPVNSDGESNEDWMILDETNPFESYIGYDAGTSLMIDDQSIGVCYDQSVSVPLIGFGTPAFEIPYVTPFVTIWLRAGAKGHVDVGFGQRACWGHSTADIDPSVVAAAAENGIDACPDRLDLSATLNPSAGIGAFVEVGVADNASIVEVGLRGDVTLASLSLPMTAGVTTDVSTTIGAEPNFSFAPTLTLLRGALSVYVRLAKVLKVFQHTFMEFGGINFTKVYEDGQWRDICIFVEAEAFGSGSACAVAGCGDNLCKCEADGCGPL